MRLIHSLFLILFFATACKGQDKTSRFKNSGDTSPSNTQTINNTTYGGSAAIFRCSLLDKAGNLWFGTTGRGLFRYNGKTFISYTEKDGLCNAFIYALAEDRSGNIWIGTTHGLCFYNGKKFTQIPLPSPAAQAGPSTQWETLSVLPNKATAANMVLSIFQG
jgi:ligand-binding sensor domain-containing protein